MTRKDFLTLFGLVPIGGGCLAKAGAVDTAGLPVVPSLDEPLVLPFAQARTATPFIRTADMRILQDRMLYCRWKLPPAREVPRVHYFFGDPLGRDRSLSDTNMHMAGCLPLPREQLVQRILFLFSPQMLDRDRDLLMSRYSYELQVGSKIRHQGPLVRFPLVADLTLLERTHGGFAARESIPVQPKIRAPFCVELQEPVHIPAGAYFTAEVSGEPFELTPADQGGAGLDLICALDGMGCFAIQ